MWLGGAALTFSMTMGTCALSRAWDAYAQVTQVQVNDKMQDKALEQGKADHDGVVALKEQIGQVQRDVSELKLGQAAQQRLLEDIRAKVGTPRREPQ